MAVEACRALFQSDRLQSSPAQPLSAAEGKFRTLFAIQNYPEALAAARSPPKSNSPSSVGYDTTRIDGISVLSWLPDLMSINTLRTLLTQTLAPHSL
jgi:hypothetical protein